MRSPEKTLLARHSLVRQSQKQRSEGSWRRSTIKHYAWGQSTSMIFFPLRVDI